MVTCSSFQEVPKGAMADSFPRRADHFREWSKLMLDQARVPDRPQYKSTSSTKSVKGGMTSRRKRGKRFRRRKRNKQQE